jgi:preprotein translocase subunit SecA
LQVIKNFEFSTPDDAVYHLLNICQSFEVDATKTGLIISGMVDANSNLYNELYKYFLKIDFTTLPENFNYTEEIKNSPAHYFSHLFATAACVL